VQRRDVGKIVQLLLEVVPQGVYEGENQVIVATCAARIKKLLEQGGLACSRTRDN
jgi:hypothetical protein